MVHASDRENPVRVARSPPLRRTDQRPFMLETTWTEGLDAMPHSGARAVAGQAGIARGEASEVKGGGRACYNGPCREVAGHAG